MSNIPINITVRHLNEPSSKFQTVIREELGKLDNFSSVNNFGVVVEGISKITNGVELHRRVEITAATKGNNFAAAAEEENFGKALDSAIAKIKAQLSKYHEKASDHKSIPTSEAVK